MHRSRIGIVLIDHPDEHYDEALVFWADATGGTATPPRVHLDIETDDVAAEVARLVALGASVSAEPEGYVVMHDPGGLVFCVVPVQTGDRFEAAATTWG